MDARWRVLGQEPREELQRDGTFAKVWEIRFELLDSGQQATVIVHDRNHTAEFVAAEITRTAGRMAAINDLTG